jgi:hypothetical protein
MPKISSRQCEIHCHFLTYVICDRKSGSKSLAKLPHRPKTNPLAEGKITEGITEVIKFTEHYII